MRVAAIAAGGRYKAIVACADVVVGNSQIRPYATVGLTMGGVSIAAMSTAGARVLGGAVSGYKSRKGARARSWSESRSTGAVACEPVTRIAH